MFIIYKANKSIIFIHSYKARFVSACKGILANNATIQETDLDVEWLLNNHNRLVLSYNSVIKEIYRFNKKLPKMRGGSIRAYEIAREYVDMHNGVVTMEALLEFFAKKDLYLLQDEVWLQSLFLRIALLERLSYLAEETLNNILERVHTNNEKIGMTDSDNFRGTTIGCCIKSLYGMSDIDIEKLAVNTLEVERILRQDPTNGFNISDKVTKQAYRESISSIAKRNNTTETEIAIAALYLAKSSTDMYYSNIGAYLLGDGQRLLYEYLGKRFSSTHTGMRLFLYIASILTLASGFIAPFIWYIYINSIEYMALYMALFIVFALPLAYVSAKTIVNFVLSYIIKPRSLPRIDKDNIDYENNKSIMVIPALISNKDRARELIERLETHYISNAVPNSAFVLLGDYKDCKQKESEQDGEISSYVRTGIDKLNKKYNCHAFYYYHRDRVYYKKDALYMGWERKRGALEQFTKMCAGETQAFNKYSDKPSAMAGVKYIFTVDADTALVPESFSLLLGNAVHPLNKPYSENGIVKKGYGLFQPAIAIKKSEKSTAYIDIFSPRPGIDTYSFSVSNVYMDLFHRGNYCGKGLYSVEAYTEVLSGAIKENTVLSHDLLEGEYLRCAIVHSVIAMDDFPADLLSSVNRNTRWLRGDFQLLPWLKGRLKNEQGKRVINPLNSISKYKILDNITTWMFYPNLLILALLVLFILPAQGIVYGIFLASLVLIPFIIDILGAIIMAMMSLGGKFILKDLVPSIYKSMLATAINIAFVAYLGLQYLSYAFRALYRMAFTRKRMLEWVTAKDSESIFAGLQTNIYFYRMLSTLPLALFIVVAGVSLDRNTIFAFVLGIVWLIAPFIAHMLSLNKKQEVSPIRDYEEEALSQLFHRTWVYFATALRPEFHYLVPDNFHEVPHLGYANRTSPTNIGYSMLAVVSAAEMAVIPPSEAVRLTDNILCGIEELDMYCGNLYNWYNILSMQPLEPRIVSSVDSGNFVICLLLCAKFFEDISNKNIELDNVKRAFNHAINIEIENGVSQDIKNFLLEMKLLIEDAKDIAEFIIASREILNNKIIQKQKELLYPLYILQIWNDYFCKEIDKNSYQETANRLYSIAYNTDLSVLYDTKKELFYLCYNATEEKFSKHYYDMLCSEARLCSFVAISLGQISAAHWFKLSRTAGRIENYPVILSWSGTAFEYLMPELFFRTPENSMLHYSALGAVKAQIEYGKTHKIPFGVSECAYYSFDNSGEYKYQAFGVQATALATICNEKVITPYASLLALSFAPRECVDNIAALVADGALSRFGMYEALDYNHKRTGYRVSAVKSYMSHHQGMIICALCNFLQNDSLKNIFHSLPIIKANELLLSEKAPIGVMPEEQKQEATEAEVTSSRLRHSYYDSFLCDFPHAGVLCGDKLHGVYTVSGASGLFYGTKSISGIGRDYLTENGGTNVYIKNTKTGAIYNPGFLPTKNNPISSSVEISDYNCKYTRVDGNVKTEQEVFISWEMDAEVRRISVTNSGAASEFIIMLANDVILLDQRDYLAHKAFNGLTIETSFLEDSETLLCHKRARGGKEIYLAQKVMGNGDTIYETDRAAFIGRNNSKEHPMFFGHEIYNTGFVGAPIEPIMAIGKKVLVESGETVDIYFITSASSEQGTVIDAMNRLLPAEIELQRDLAKGKATALLQFSKIHDGDREVLDYILDRLIFNSAMYGLGTVINKNSLWRYGLCAEKPMVCIEIDDLYDIKRLEQLFRICKHIKQLGIASQWVILDRSIADYSDASFRAIEKLIQKYQSITELVVHLRGSNIGVQETQQIKASSAIVFDVNVPLIEQLCNISDSDKQDDYENEKEVTYSPSVLKKPVMDFYNGFGGFSEGGKEYNIILNNFINTPLPWSNVLSNKSFGVITTENGGGYTYALNSRQNKLTPWHNDSVENPVGECVYVRDEQSGKYWSISPMPKRYGDEYLITYGLGYTMYQYGGFGLLQSQKVFVHADKQLKAVSVNITEATGVNRNISLTYFADMLLGVGDIEHSQYRKAFMHNGMLCFINTFQEQEGIAYVYCNNAIAEYSYDRAGFIGRYGSVLQPIGMKQKKLANNPQMRDDCALCRLDLELKPNDSQTVVFYMGWAENLAEIDCIKQYLQEFDTEKELLQVINYWQDKVSVIKVTTPNKGLDYQMNGWLLYQTIACRFFARTSMYQAGGAIGFRDQLQDCLAMLYSMPEAVKEHILMCAGHQFIEGDVQHWWHEPRRGVRTHITDDLLFLPFVAVQYAVATGDFEIFSENVPYLYGREPIDTHSIYEEHQVSNEVESLYMHCIRAINRACKWGDNGLPLIGTGDWNDALDNIGAAGIGESVFLGWFLLTVITEFMPIMAMHNDTSNIEKYKEIVKHLLESIEQNAWDGKWYRRAFTDEGDILGSTSSKECKIDLLVQSFAVISGLGNPERIKTAIASAKELLVNEYIGVISLLSPAFNSTQPNPGYIQSYIPGIRENGGQYTHAAIWFLIANLILGEGKTGEYLYNMLSPINHCLSKTDVLRYKGEPYVIAADVYSNPQQAGRAGWTWYTGAAAWMYVAMLKHCIGLNIMGDRIEVMPCISSDWDGITIEYKYQDTQYIIGIYNPDHKATGVQSITQDGVKCEEIKLVNDGLVHKIRVIM